MLCRLRNFHGYEHEVYCVMGYEAVQFGSEVLYRRLTGFIVYRCTTRTAQEITPVTCLGEVTSLNPSWYTAFSFEEFIQSLQQMPIPNAYVIQATTAALQIIQPLYTDTTLS